MAATWRRGSRCAPHGGFGAGRLADRGGWPCNVLPSVTRPQGRLGAPARKGTRVLYMVVERFVAGPEPVYARAEAQGRMLPDGVRYVDSWIADDGRYDTCFQLMDTEDADLLQAWMDRWSDLIEFAVHPLIDSAEVKRRLAAPES